MFYEWVYPLHHVPGLSILNVFRYITLRVWHHAFFCADDEHVLPFLAFRLVHRGKRKVFLFPRLPGVR